MPIPFWSALKIVPWAMILTGAPALVRAADTLVAGAKGRRGDLGSSGDLAGLEARVERLEQQGRADAELLKQVTGQLAALATALEVLAARQRWLMVFGIAALALALTALTLVLV